MADKIRTFVTSAVQAAAQPMTWMGRSTIRIGYLDKVHRTEKGVEHLEKCVEYKQEEIKAKGFDLIEARGPPHPGHDKKPRMTIYLWAKKVIVGAGHLYMNGKMEFFQHGPETVELPKDVHVPWIEEAEAAEAAPEKKAVEKPL